MISLHSVVKLGWAFVKVLARRVFGNRASQLPRFVANYEADGIVLFERDDPAVLDAASRCTGCGRCDAQALLEGSFEALGPRGPMAFVLGVARHSGAHDTAELRGDASAEALRALTEACPVRVPFVPLAALVRRRNAAQASARTLERGPRSLEPGVELAPRDAGVSLS